MWVAPPRVSSKTGHSRTLQKAVSSIETGRGSYVIALLPALDHGQRSHLEFPERQDLFEEIPECREVYAFEHLRGTVELRAEQKKTRVFGHLHLEGIGPPMGTLEATRRGR